MKILNPDIRRIQRVTSKPGWDGYKGGPTDTSVAEVAEIMSLSAPSLSPCAAGIQFEWHEQGYDIEIAIYPDGTMEANWKRSTPCTKPATS